MHQYILQMMKKRYSQEIESSSELRSLGKYKKRLLIEVVILFFFCLTALLERVFYQIITESENNYLNYFQINNNLVELIDGNISPKDIASPFFTFWSTLSSFNFQFLFCTHIFISLYVAFDTKTSAKIILISLTIIQIVTFFQLTYKGARPYWSMDEVQSSSCLPNYNHPDLGVILQVFIPSYTYFCWKQLNKQTIVLSNDKCNVFGLLTIVSIIVLSVFLNYVTGTIFLINIFLSLVFTLAFFVIFSYADKTISRITNLLMYGQYSKSIQLKWVFGIIVSILFILMTYSSQSTFQNISWVSNQVSCKNRMTEGINFNSYNQIIGHWFTFKQTTSSFAMIAFILAFPFCNSRMKSRQWCKGTPKQRIANIIIANVLLVPSWLFEVLLKEDRWIKQIGLNSYIIDGIHYFIIYLFLFGIVPPIIFQKVFQTTERLDYNPINNKNDQF